MNKSIQNPNEVIQVTKVNFFESLSSFKDNIANPLFDYAILNCDFSTLTNSNSDREIVFTEIALCHKVNTSQDISHRVFIYLISSIKFNKYIQDSKIAFSSESLKYFVYNKSVYNLKDLTSKNALSYNNLSNEQLISDSLTRILKDGKKSKKENMKSYYYYPKALNIHSLKFQRRLEEILKSITMLITQEDYINISEKELNEAKYIAIPVIEESNYNLVSEILAFKWNLLLQPYITDMIKMYIEGIEFSLVKTPQNNTSIEYFCAFISLLNEYFESEGQKELLPFSKAFDDDLYENWRLFLLNEIKAKITLNHTDSQSGDMIEFKILKEEEIKTEHIQKFLNGLLLFIDSINNDDNIKSTAIRDLYFNNWNLLTLLPKDIVESCQIKYCFGVKLNMKVIKIDKEHIDSIMNKITYEQLYLNVDNKEEILFGYEFETELYKLIDEMKKRKNGYISLKLEFGKDMQLLIQNNEFKEMILSIANNFVIEEKKIGLFSIGISYSLIDNKDISEDTLRKNLCIKASEIKASLLIQEELGVSLFYRELFSSKARIYGSNLYSKLAFVIQEVFNYKTDASIESQVKEFIMNKSLSLYDLNYISRMNQFSFYEQYSQLAKDHIANITLRFYYIINNLKNRITQSNKNQLSSNDLYFNIDSCSLESIKKDSNDIKNKTLMITKGHLNQIQLLSIAKKYGNFILNPYQDNSIYRLDFLDSEEKYRNLKSVIDNLI